MAVEPEEANLGSAMLMVVAAVLIVCGIAAALFLKPGAKAAGCQQKPSAEKASAAPEEVQAQAPAPTAEGEATEVPVTYTYASDAAEGPLSKPVAAASPKPRAKATAKVAAKASAAKLRHPEDCPILKKGKEHLEKLQAVEAENVFGDVIGKRPSDWRGYYGKAQAMQQQQKYLMAFRSCREGLEQVPTCQELKDLQEVVRQQHKARSRQPPPPEPDCPISAPPGSKEAIEQAVKDATEAAERVPLRNPNQAERERTKSAMLNIFREQWERLGKAKDSAMLQYSPEQKLGLSIKGGHQPMARPDDVLLPDDYQQPIGIVNAETLGKFSGENPRLMICLYGDVFDVSDRPDKYGAEGPYGFFGGKDITWGLMIGADTVENCNQFFDIHKLAHEDTMKKMQAICSWLAFYEVEYGKPIGRLEEYNDEEKLPMPPHTPDACVVQ